MVPNVSGFNQSATASEKCARVVCRFPCSSATAQGMAKLYKGSIFVITEAQFAIQSQVM